MAMGPGVWQSSLPPGSCFKQLTFWLVFRASGAPASSEVQLDVLSAAARSRVLTSMAPPKAVELFHKLDQDQMEDTLAKMSIAEIVSLLSGAMPHETEHQKQAGSG